jgi:hypothetical protein
MCNISVCNRAALDAHIIATGTLDTTDMISVYDDPAI